MSQKLLFARIHILDVSVHLSQNIFFTYIKPSVERASEKRRSVTKKNLSICHIALRKHKFSMWKTTQFVGKNANVTARAFRNEDVGDGQHRKAH